MTERSYISNTALISLLIAVNVIIVAFTPFAEDSLIKSAVRVCLNTALGYGLWVSIGRWWPIRALLSLSIYSTVLLALTYHSNISLAVVFSIVGATTYESWDFIRTNYLSMLLAGTMALAAFLLQPKRQRHLDALATVFALVYIVVPASIHPFIHPERFDIEQQEARAKGFSKPMEITQIVLDNTPAFKSPPLEMFKGAFDALSFSVSRAKSQLGSSWTNVVSNRDSDLIVVAIGESLSANHLGLYGYYRDTTPQLDALADQISAIDDVFSAGTNTWSSIPTTLTGLGSIADPSQSLVNLAKDAGYKTFWISNQGQFSEWDFVVSALAKQSDADFFMSEQEGGEQYDSVVVEKFTSLLHDPNMVNLQGKNLFVLHFYGSHPSFVDRYPREAEHFTGSDNPLLDQYDNSVRYTDQLQHDIINSISTLGGRYVFFADHGLGKPSGPMAFKHDVRKVPDVESLRVPLLFYPAYTPPEHMGERISLMKFLCVFGAWAEINASELNAENCDSDGTIRYFDVNMNLNQYRFE